MVYGCNVAMYHDKFNYLQRVLSRKERTHMDDTKEIDVVGFREKQRVYRNLPYGAKRLAATLDALSAAEGLDPSSRASVLYDLAWAYAVGDDPAKALPTCAEFFALLEQYPDAVNSKTKAPSAAMIANYVAMELPQIPLAQCRSLLEQFHQQVKKYGIGERLWQIHACHYSLMTGDEAGAEQHLQAFRTTPRDAISDCEACEAGNTAECLMNLGRREEAKAVLQPVLDGSLTCGHQPWSSLSMLIHDALDHGELEEAEVLGQRLAHAPLRNCSDLTSAGALLRLWAATDLGRTISLLEKGISWSIGMWDQSLLFDLYRGAWAVCSKLGERQEKIPLQLPKKFPCWQADGIYDSGTLAEWFYTQMGEIANRFDRRNGTTIYADKRMPK